MPNKTNHLRYSNLSKQEKNYVTKETKAISNKIKEKRNQLGVSQEQLSEILDLSVGTIKSIEQNIRSPSLVTLIRITRALKMSIFLSDNKNKPN